MKPQTSPMVETNKIVEFETEDELSEDIGPFFPVIDERDRFFDWSVEPELLMKPNSAEKGN